MVDVNQIGASFAQGFTGIMPQMMRYLGYIVWGIIILGGLWLGYILIQYKFKYLIFNQDQAERQDQRKIGYD